MNEACILSQFKLQKKPVYICLANSQDLADTISLPERVEDLSVNKKNSKNTVNFFY